MLRWPLLLTVGVVVFVVHTLSRVDTVYDSRWSLPTALSLIEEGDVDLDEYPDADPSRDWRVVWRRGHRYGLYPVGPSVVALPFVWLAVRLAPGLLGVDLAAVIHQRPVARLEVLIASFLVALTTMLLVLLAARRAPPRVALLCGLLFAFATPTWSSATRALWQHAPAMLCVVGSLCCLASAEEHARCHFGAGLLAALAFFMRPTAALGLLVLAAWSIARRRPGWGWLLFGAAVPVLAWVAVSYGRYGSLVPPSYGRASGFAPSAWGWLGLLVSPSRGLLIWSPVLLLALPRLVGAGRPATPDALAEPVAAMVWLHWLLVSLWHCWWGGGSIGPRLLCDVSPLLCYLALPALVALTAPGPRRAGRLALLLLLAAPSLGIHAYAANAWAVTRWNQEPVSVDQHPERCWSWRDPQFGRGWLQPPGGPPS